MTVEQAAEYLQMGKSAVYQLVREETDQPRRWMALALTETEKGFRKLAGYRDLPRLAQALAREPEAMADAA